MVKRHLIKHHNANANQVDQKKEKGPKDAMHSCDQCDKQYKRKEHLQQHTTSQHTNQRHTCDQCGKQFKRSQHLKRHTITEHTNARHTCNTCEMQFKRIESLKQHQKKNCINIK